MARRRDARTFGRGQYIFGLRRDEERWREGFPLDVPAVAAIERLRLDAPITLLAGDNGSGKSTIVEALARAMGFAAEGDELDRLGELPAVPRAVFNGALKPVLTPTKPRGGYFLRAERLYLFDEPEAALSVSGVLALLAIVVRAARAGAQFVIATHSPVLLACPDARLYELDDEGVAIRGYDDLEAVRLTRAFLDAPERFIRAALDDSDA